MSAIQSSQSSSKPDHIAGSRHSFVSCTSGARESSALGPCFSETDLRVEEACGHQDSVMDPLEVMSTPFPCTLADTVLTDSALGTLCFTNAIPEHRRKELSEYLEGLKRCIDRHRSLESSTALQPTHPRSAEEEGGPKLEHAQNFDKAGEHITSYDSILDDITQLHDSFQYPPICQTAVDDELRKHSESMSTVKQQWRNVTTKFTLRHTAWATEQVKDIISEFDNVIQSRKDLVGTQPRASVPVASHHMDSSQPSRTGSESHRFAAWNSHQGDLHRLSELHTELQPFNAVIDHLYKFSHKDDQFRKLCDESRYKEKEFAKLGKSTDSQVDAIGRDLGLVDNDSQSAYTTASEQGDGGKHGEASNDIDGNREESEMSEP